MNSTNLKKQGDGERLTIPFNGLNFHRYPGSTFFASRNYFRACKNGNFFLLHREVYKAKNGEIPKDYVVHHIDHNPLNNDISNLELKSASEHHSEHLIHRIASDPRWFSSDTHKKRLATRRGEYPEKNKEPAVRAISNKCKLCSVDFESKTYRAVFCSKKCGMKDWRMRNGRKKQAILS